MVLARISRTSSSSLVSSRWSWPQEPTCSTSSIVVEGQMGASLHTHSRGWGLGQGWVRAQQQPPGCSAGERHWKRSILRSPRFVTHNKSQIRTTTRSSAFKPNKRRKQKQALNNFHWADHSEEEKGNEAQRLGNQGHSAS